MNLATLFGIPGWFLAVLCGIAIAVVLMKKGLEWAVLIVAVVLLLLVLPGCYGIDATNTAVGEIHARPVMPWRVAPPERRTTSSGPCGTETECQGTACDVPSK